MFLPGGHSLVQPGMDRFPPTESRREFDESESEVHRRRAAPGLEGQGATQTLSVRNIYAAPLAPEITPTEAYLP